MEVGPLSRMLVGLCFGYGLVPAKTRRSNYSREVLIGALVGALGGPSTPRFWPEWPQKNTCS